MHQFLEVFALIDRLDLVGKLVQSEVIESARSVGAGLRLKGPLVVDLDPTTRCDLSCPECISGDLLTGIQFSTERLLKFASEFEEAGVRAVVLIGGGEPLLHPGTRELIEKLHARRIAVGVVTNGVLIDTALIQLAKYAAWTRVSVDAATKETYGSVRPGRRGKNQFQRVIDNIRALAKIAQGSVGFSFLIIGRKDESGSFSLVNGDEILAAAKLAHSLGCDYFEVKMMFDMGHNVIRNDDSGPDRVRDQLAAARMFGLSVGLEVITSSTIEQFYDQSPQPKPYRRCLVSELRTVVTPTGMYQCSYHRGVGAAKLGDLRDMTLSDAWRTADTGLLDPRELCLFDCARHAQNMLLPELASDPFVEAAPLSDPFI